MKRVSKLFTLKVAAWSQLNNLFLMGYISESQYTREYEAIRKSRKRLVLEKTIRLYVSLTALKLKGITKH